MVDESMEIRARKEVGLFLSFLRVIEKGTATVKITSPDEYVAWSETLKMVKGRIKEVKARYKEFKEPLNRLRKLFAEVFDPTIKRAELIEETIKVALLDWHTHEEARRQAEQAQIEATLAQEHAARQVKAEATAMRFEAAGAVEEAQIVRDTVPPAPPPVYVAPQTPRVSGQAFRSEWRYEILNEALLPRWVLMPNHAKLREIAETKKIGAEVPGVRFYEEKILASSSS